MKPGDYMATTLVLFVERVDAHTTRLIEPKRCFGFKYKLDAPVASFWGFGDELIVKLFFRS